MSIAPVRKTIEVKASLQQAFEVFTEGMSRWWIRSHSINPSRSPIQEVHIEPFVNGRWFERGVDGSECDWGKVLAWEPHARLILAWQISGHWQYDPTLMTEVEITFTEIETGFTRVDLEHRNIERFGDNADALRVAFDSSNGWSSLLEAFAAAL